MKIVQGDLIKLAIAGEFDVIVHGCNCQCTMRRGIAKTIRAEFPAAYAADQQTTTADRQKLGSFSAAVIQRNGHEITVVNGYTQYHWRGKGVKVDYTALRNVMVAIRANYSGKRIGYPKIGAGLAGGDWDTIAAIIEDVLAGEDHTLVEFSPTAALI